MIFKSKSQRNEVYADFLKKQQNVKWEWVIIIYFYAALHLVKSFIIKKLNLTLSDVKSHKDIHSYLLDAVRRNLIPEDVRRSYGKLYWASRTGRYDYSPSPQYPNDISKFDDVKYVAKAHRLIAGDYRSIKSFISPLI